MIDDPIHHLERYARAVADAYPSTVDPSALAARIMATPLRRRWSRWQRLFAGFGALVVLGSGAAVAAVVLKERVSDPRTVACRAAFAVNSSVTVLPMSADPIGSCAALWETGQLPDPDRPGPGGAAPYLIACVGPQRAMDVFPVFDLESSCETLGLSPADVEAAVDDPMLELDDRVYRINKACISVEQAEVEAPKLIDEFDLDGWTVTVVDRDDECGRISIDPTIKQLVIFPSPLHPGG